MTDQPQKQAFSFEEAYSRLEQILEELNSGEASLEKSLELYEEADRLISHCSHKLSFAEQKIQTLIKNRSGELALDETGQPQVDNFEPQAEEVLTRHLDSSYEPNT